MGSSQLNTLFCLWGSKITFGWYVVMPGEVFATKTTVIHIQRRVELAQQLKGLSSNTTLLLRKQPRPKRCLSFQWLPWAQVVFNLSPSMSSTWVHTRCTIISSSPDSSPIHISVLSICKVMTRLQEWEK